MCRIREGATHEKVNEFLSDRVAALGFKPPELVTSPDVLEYSRLPARTKDTELIELEVLRTMRGDVRWLADPAAFQGAMAPLPKDATLAVYANGDLSRSRSHVAAVSSRSAGGKAPLRVEDVLARVSWGDGP